MPSRPGWIEGACDCARFVSARFEKAHSCRLSGIASILIALRRSLTGGRYSAAKPGSIPVFARKRGGWGVFAGNSSYVVECIGVVGWLPGVFARFCARLLRISARLEPGGFFRHGACPLEDFFHDAPLGKNSRQCRPDFLVDLVVCFVGF